MVAQPAIEAQAVQALTGHSGAIYALAQGRDSAHVFSAGADKIVAEWSLTAGAAQPFAVRTEASVYSLAHLAAQQLLVIGRSDGGMHFIDLQARKELRFFTLHTGGIFKLLELPGGLLAAASADGTLSIWDVAAQALVRQLPLSAEKLRDLAYNAANQLLAVAAGDGCIYLINATTWQVENRLAGHDGSVFSVAWHPNGKWLISGGKDAHLRFWNGEKQFELARSIPAHNFGIYGIAFNVSGTVCATVSRDKTVKLWNPDSFDYPLRLDAKKGGHKNSVNCLLWKSDAQLLTAGDDRQLIEWKIKS